MYEVLGSEAEGVALQCLELSLSTLEVLLISRRPKDGRWFNLLERAVREGHVSGQKVVIVVRCAARAHTHTHTHTQEEGEGEREREGQRERERE